MCPESEVYAYFAHTVAYELRDGVLWYQHAEYWETSSGHRIGERLVWSDKPLHTLHTFLYTIGMRDHG